MRTISNQLKGLSLKLQDDWLHFWQLQNALYVFGALLVKTLSLLQLTVDIYKVFNCLLINISLLEISLIGFIVETRLFLLFGLGCIQFQTIINIFIRIWYHFANATARLVISLVYINVWQRTHWYNSFLFRYKRPRFGRWEWSIILYRNFC